MSIITEHPPPGVERVSRRCRSPNACTRRSRIFPRPTPVDSFGRTSASFNPGPVSDTMIRTFSPAGCATTEISAPSRSEEHTSELQSLMRISYAVFCLNKKKKNKTQTQLQMTLSQPYKTLLTKQHRTSYINTNNDYVTLV